MKRVLAALLAVLSCVAAARAATYTLSVSTAGPTTPLAVVTSTPSGIVCPGTCSAAFSTGTAITLGVTYTSTIAFAGWSGTAGCVGNLSSCAFTLGANLNATASFWPLLQLTINGTGVGEVVDSSGDVYGMIGNPDNTGSAAYAYPVGTALTLTASTGPASSFTGWTGAGACTSSPTCAVTLNAYTNAIATFTASGTVGVSSFTVAVVVPFGGGSVTSTPAGIACPSAACAAAFVSGGSVALATAAASGYYFAGWANGGCSGLTPCTVTATSPLQGNGGANSPAAFFYPIGGPTP